MSTTAMTLDGRGVALLDQVLLGLRSLTELADADVYADEEGTPLATRSGSELVATHPRPWSRPEAVRSARPVVIAVDGEIPVGDEPLREALLLLPAGGHRLDDARVAAWARAWRAVADAVVEVPVPPDEAAERAHDLASAYSTGGQLTVPTKPQPRGDGRVLFFTGLSGSGKSTIARAVVARLVADHTVTLLDGDIVRTHLSKGLGFSREDRDVNIRRIGWVAAEVAKHGGIAVCAPIAPYDETRQWVRRVTEQAAGPGAFALVWVSTPLAACEARDIKGLYAKARSGQLPGFTGIDDPYETPTDADLVIDTTRTSVDDAVDAVLAMFDDVPR